ncbi:MAG: BRCT domain-containing protein [Eubacteriales bacterium]|nr:BRCT domain-containing protein [Eubacteriales bacterium]MDD4390655.1 BRCT domain-containing protein [Eubacteriales bacterium]
MSTLQNYDSMDYRIYTGKSEFDKALSTLIGIIDGITIDGKVNKEEAEELFNWLAINEILEGRTPFNEIVPALKEMLRDGVVDDEEIDDLKWLCGQFKGEGLYYNLTTLAIQELHALFHGLLADNVLTDQEILSLRDWISENYLLKGTYPYDEVEALLSSILQDGIITEDERKMLIAYIGDFIDCTSSYNISASELAELKATYTINGICAINPQIEIPGRTFCFTGASSRCTRNEIAIIITEREGTFNSGVSGKTQFLLIGDEGNPCWAFNCYGRKVEKAVELRKKGIPVQIIHENDFWVIIE